MCHNQRLPRLVSSAVSGNQDRNRRRQHPSYCCSLWICPPPRMVLCLFPSPMPMGPCGRAPVRRLNHAARSFPRSTVCSPPCPPCPPRRCPPGLDLLLSFPSSVSSLSVLSCPLLRVLGLVCHQGRCTRSLSAHRLVCFRPRPSPGEREWKRVSSRYLRCIPPFPVLAGHGFHGSQGSSRVGGHGSAD